MDLKRDMSWKSWFLISDRLPWGSRLLCAPRPTELWRWNTKKSTPSYAEGTSVSQKSCSQFCSDVDWCTCNMRGNDSSSEKSTASDDESMPLILDLYICSSNLIDFLEGVDFFVLHVERSYGGGTQRSRPPQMPRELLPLRNLALSSAQMPIDVPVIWEAMISHLRSRPPQMTNQCLLILDHVHM